LQRALVADSPHKPLLLGLAEFLLVALCRRDWRPLRCRAKDSWNQQCVVLVAGASWTLSVMLVQSEPVRVVRLLVTLVDAVSWAWLNPVPRGSSGRWSDARLQSRHCPARWCGWFDTRLCASAVR